MSNHLSRAHLMALAEMLEVLERNRIYPARIDDTRRDGGGVRATVEVYIATDYTPLRETAQNQSSGGSEDSDE